MDACPHDPSMCRYDASMDSEICTGCGLVMTMQHSCTTTLCASDSTESSVHHHHQSTMDVKDLRKLRRITDGIQNLCHTMKLVSGVEHTARQLAEDAFRAGLKTRETTTDAFIASVVYYACKVMDIDRAEIELVVNGNITMKQLTVMNKLVRRRLCHIQLDRPPNPARLIPRFLDALLQPPSIVRVDDRHWIRRDSEDLALRVTDSGILEGKSPECCCLTYLCHVAIQNGTYDQSLISKVCERCGLTPGTITNALSILQTM